MTPWTIVLRSLLHFWRNNLAIAAGAAIATAVLTGALLVGDSMRSSLRELVIDQLGTIDTILVGEGFFNQRLASDIAAQMNPPPVSVSSLILFPNGTVERRRDDPSAGQQIDRSANVNIWGIDPSFWAFDSQGSRPQNSPTGDTVVINQSLADRLGIENVTGQKLPTVTLRIPKPTQLPAESALGATDDLIESLVDLQIGEIVPDQGLGRLSLQPSQISGPNLFIDITTLQQRLARSALKNRSSDQFCNAVLFSDANDSVDDATESNRTDVANRLAIEANLTLEDIGLSLTRVTQTDPQSPTGQPVFDYWNLSSEKLVFGPSMAASIANALPSAKPVITYLANDIRKTNEPSGVPFSMVSAIGFDDEFRLTSVTDQIISSLADDEIVLNQWAADDLDAAVGDDVSLEYFLPETTHGNQVTAVATFTVAAIAKLTQPDRPFQVRRRNQVVDAVFVDSPTMANDPDLTPTVPGVTDSQSIENWELPFSTAGKIRPQDDDYWSEYRTTPKAFIAPSRGRQLFNSRFGVTTSFRVSSKTGDASVIEQKLLKQFDVDQTDLGLRMIPIRQRSLAAASGSTPFDALFLALSMFVILSALILVWLLFRLAIQSRIAEVGLLKAVGIGEKRVAGIWMREMVIVCWVGSLLGILVGVGYGWLMVYGLKTWWVGAISTPFLKLFVSPVSLIIGLVSGTFICGLTIAWSLRQTRRESVRRLLAGQIEAGDRPQAQRRPGVGRAVTWALVIGAVGLLGFAFTLSGDAKSGAFMGAGFLVLIAALRSVQRWLKPPVGHTAEESAVEDFSLMKLAFTAARRNPLRSTLTISLVSVASFLIIAVSSFRLAPTEFGTGGFDYVATSSRPLFADLNTSAGQSDLLGDRRLDQGVEVFSMRLKPGQDASCNNLYQSTQPQVIGVPDELADRFEAAENQFQWAGFKSLADAGDRPVNPSDDLNAVGVTQNPWRLLRGPPQRSPDLPVPVVIDKNTANYSLKIFALGTIYEVQFDSGERVKFEVVGFLSNTILQGSLLIGESDFKRIFPSVAGYRYFLIDASKAASPVDQIASLESALGDQGFDAQSAVGMLEDFMAVQNTYLSTFQSLGGLGLLLGTLGLAAVQIRSVIERTRELGLLRAVGFSSGRIANLIFLETSWLLMVGLGVGVLSALFATVPHFVFGGAVVPWSELGVIFAVIIASGVVTSYAASRTVTGRAILSSLRD